MIDVKLLEDASGVFGPVIDSNGDWIGTDGLESVIAILLGTDARAEEYEINDAIKRRGWIGDEYETDDYSLGSKIWLKSQSRNTTKDSNEILAHVKNALSVLVPDFFKDITAEIIRSSGSVQVKVNLLKFDNKTDTVFYRIANNTGAQ